MSMERIRRVVITGLGVICPIGTGREQVWDAVLAGRSGVRRPSTLSPEALPLRAVGEATQFTGSIKDFGNLEKETQKTLRKALKVMCRECQMGVAAAQLALNDSAATGGSYAPDRFGTSFGSDYMVSAPEEFAGAFKACMDENGAFCFDRWPVLGMPQLFPLWLLKYLPNMPASHVAIYNDLRGPSNSVTMREASPAICLEDALHVIRTDRADAVIVGVTGTRISLSKAIHAVQQEEMVFGDGDPSAAVRPFDRLRSGMVPGEGAAAVVLEDASLAQKRGARIEAEVVAAVSAAAVERNGVASRRAAMRQSIRCAIHDSGLIPQDVGFVMAHGIGTRSGDREEALALADVFGPFGVPVIAAKSYFGNLGAASGLVEMILGILALNNNLLFATLNHTTPDPDCPVRVVTEQQPPSKPAFLFVSVTPQGQASAAVVRKFVEA